MEELLLRLAAQVKLLLMDVDGVLTDARLIIGDDGQEYKAFNSRDGHGIKMLIRAGVQDREMVEALGINVRQVFTLVFVIGAGLAALGGIGAAPFIPIEANMGDLFQIQAFICVVIGGMGSFSGAAVGALLLGLARAFGDYLALQFGMSPAISTASTVIIMAIVLLVRPAGLFGRKE